MQILRHTESCNIGDQKNALLKQLSESIKLENGYEAEIMLLAKGKEIHPSLIVGAEKIFEILVKHIVATEESDFYNRFEEALKKLNHDFLEFEKDLQQNILEKMSISISVFVDDHLYLSQHGIDIEVYLIRSRHVSIISGGLDEKGKENELFVNIASGKLEDSDIVLSSTERLLRYITKFDLGKMFTGKNIAEALEALKQSLSIELSNQICVSVNRINIIKEDEAEQIHLPKTEEKIISSGQTPKQKDQIKKFLKDLHKKAKELQAKLRQKDISNIWNNLISSRYRLPIILGGVILILIILLFIIQANAKSKKELKAMDDLLNQVELNIQTAISKGTYDKETAGNILKKAEEDARIVFNSGYSRELRSKTSQILTEIQKQRDNLDKIVRVTTPQLVADLTSVRDDINALGIILSLEKNLYVYEYNALYTITGDEIADKVTIDNTEQVISGTYNEDENELLFLTSNDKIISYKNGNFQFIDTSDGAWRSGNRIVSYSGKIYLLSPENNQIYRYQADRNGYGKAENYNVDAELANTIDLTIDGLIYLVDNNADLQILSHGEIQNFSIQKAPIQKISQANRIFTEIEIPHLYLLDSLNNKIIVYLKDTNTGNLIYSTQYLFENIDEIQDFTIDKDSKSLYLLTKQKVYRMDIN